MNSLNATYYANHNYLLGIKDRIKKDPSNVGLCQECLNEAYKRIKEDMACYYFPENDYLSPLYKSLIDEVKRIELSTTFSTFIIPDKPEFNYQKRRYSQLNRENDEEILKFLIDHVWYNYAQVYVYNNPPSLKDASFVNKCGLFSAMLKTLCKTHGIECHEITINPGFISSAKLYDGCKFHNACIIKLASGYYLLDPSYRQFFLVMDSSLERVGIPLLDGATPGAFMVLTPQRRGLAQQLITKGYIELTPETFKDYCDGFAMSFRNGLYYKNAPKDPYKTDYSVDDYINFLEGTDNQVNHEGIDVLQRQRRPY